MRLPGLDRRRPADEERHAERLLVHEALVVQAVVAEEEALVAGVDHDRVAAQAGLVEVVEHAADVVVHRLHAGEVVLHVALVLPARQRVAGQARGRVQLEVRPGQVVGRAACSRAGRRCAPCSRPTASPARGSSSSRTARRASAFGVHGRCGALWCSIRKNGLSFGRVVDEVEREVGDDVGRVAGRCTSSRRSRCRARGRRSRPGRERSPSVEADRIAAQVPLADHAGVVAGLLQQPRHGHPAAVEPVEHRDAVQVASTAR